MPAKTTKKHVLCIRLCAWVVSPGVYRRDRWCRVAMQDRS